MSMADEIVEAESVELVHVRNTAAPATLFHTDDPVEIIARASDVARALSQVLKDQKLTTNISGRDHVRVEGWTMLGSMLGVFPVVEWTRPIDGGWEARVEARTRDGAVVGAAEAECTRAESKWKSRDDYALRSMAQTRAISKALRAPLGFVVALAGFDPTPEEELPAPEPKQFDPETDLVDGAIKGKDMPKKIAVSLNELDPTVDWPQLISAISHEKYGDNWSELDGDDARDFWRRLSNATFWMQEVSPAGEFPPISAEQIATQVARAFSGMVIEVNYREREKGLLTPEQQQIADEALAREDDVPFGEQKDGAE